ncbi:glycosyltransferase family 9 protein [Pantoea agglomerans]|uniref:Glycosyltransferase family 9 protein n=1 Tax=Enterobacter agglomerans TaxID=549 RepID=A0ACC5RR85_ENTAG|nr:glycosyltransferase family 9 protein [Pantoea agglomerans]MBK4727233.1 glycosyltransferase family 9 protein [Pantoea agglomerans]
MKESKVKWINRALTLYTFFSRYLKKNKTLNPEMEFQRIAIFSTTALGDLMFNTPAIFALKQRYPQASFVLVSSEKNRPLVDSSSWFDEVFYWDNKIRNAHRLIISLRRFKPQLTVILHSYMPYDVLCAVLSNSEYIIRDQYRVDSPLMNHWLNLYSKPYNGHLIQRKLDLLTTIGCRNDDPSMHIPVSWRAGENLDGKIRIGFQMGASEAKRCWPVGRFAELATLLCQDEQYQIVLIGGPKDRALVAEFEQRVGAKIFANVENQVGKTSLIELLTLIDGFDVLVTGDTGPLHLAIALQTATVSLYADAEPKHTGPYQDLACHVIMKMADVRSTSRQPLEKISAEAVKDKIVQLILAN